MSETVGPEPRILLHKLGSAFSVRGGIALASLRSPAIPLLLVGVLPLALSSSSHSKRSIIGW